MAIQLARKRWLNVIANESHRDGGEDGTSILMDGIGEESFAIGCSITATLAKVKKDCDGIKEHQREIEHFIFYTAKSVSNRTIDDWKKEIKETYNHKLTVICREDIAESLLDPDNAWLGRNVNFVTVSAQIFYKPF